ncbi:MAG TPA: phytanoyl-CoA dioxygenase family protein [Mycobacteriales bacterium]|jgi:ectoine hydroxylase-related dioxygenase (phytanoyl-CoA dioxygenase family)|nr:phytanoyl-CoA dioxygenase family protein [Mycobacteriales bacterium]
MGNGSALSADQRRHFVDEGYLVVEDLIDVASYLDPMVREYGDRLDLLARQLHAEGKISATYADLEFGPRLTRIYAETGQQWAQYFDFSLPLKGDIRADEPCFFSPSVFNVLRNPGVLDIVESLIGAEIYSNPVQHVRMKPPESLLPAKLDAAAVRPTPWHQDASVVIEEADQTDMITVWIPIFDATEANGCLAVAPRSHSGGLLEHCPTDRGMQLSTDRFDADRAQPVPMRRGSALFMTRTTPHCSLPNNSGEVRWSMDLRFNVTGQPTGRPEFPGFVARSRRDPASELRDPLVWQQDWLRTRERMSSSPELVGAFTREWSGAGCA